MSFYRSFLKNQRTTPAALVTAALSGTLGVFAFRRFLTGEAHAEAPRGFCPLQGQEQKQMSGFGRMGWGLTTLKLASVQTVSHNAKRLRFELPENSSLASLPLTYDKGHYIELLVKKYPNGRASSHLHSLRPGDTLSVVGPIRGYSWKPNECPQVNLIAGGAGITPMFQLIQGILNNDEETTKVKLIYGANTEEDLLLKDELAAFEHKFPDRFQAVYAVSNPSAGSLVKQGRITKELLKAELIQGGKIFVCGPPAMEQSLIGNKGLLWGKTGVLQELGFSRRQIYKF
ncbi:hypothetical protein jhhlp_008466 [Lomentospora prolificans]|uniref:FAD-binding FR-type domain-containing protein n=1 Tax=Lomentospora prolificans TaxID=41688 RepID=A0A2N3MY41_9PEZI|nr:hypothetical protein jhhlp_008466 [Lomentospora prolificans]